MARTYDVVVFGATGFTGKHCVKELAKIWDEFPDLKWAVAGRNREKLVAAVDWATEKTGRDLQQVGYICADVSNEASLNSMCQQAKLILNLVGPYHLYGQPVVEACVKNKCHHVDISGETQFMEKIELDYHERAKSSGVYIMQACGFGCIPTDMGVIFAKRSFPGILNSVESYLSIDNGPEGMGMNFGSLNSGLQMVAHFGEVKAIREKLKRAPLPDCKPKLHIRKPIFFSDICWKWSSPMAGTVIDVVNESQRYLYQKEKERPIQFSGYITQPSLPRLLGLFLIMINLALFAFFSCGRKLIEKYPGLFTFGIFSHQGPSEKQLAESSFTYQSRGRGFSSEKAANAGKEDLEIVTQVNGPELAYVTTPIVMIQAGLTILQETDKLPEKGGVYTPGAAFYKTTLIDRCHEHGVKFTVIKEAYNV